MDDLLTRSGLDEVFIQLALKNRDNLRKEALAQKLECDQKELDGFDLTADDFMRARFIEHSLVALRCNIVRFIEGNCTARDLSNQLAESHLVQWFCHIENFGVIKPPSKSTVNRYFHWIAFHDLDQLPAAVKQAHERIIGGRQVPSKEKILSLYDADINVIVRGKLGASTEMGNVLALGEQSDGLIVSWDLYQDNVTDSKTRNLPKVSNAGPRPKEESVY